MAQLLMLECQSHSTGSLPTSTETQQEQKELLPKLKKCLEAQKFPTSISVVITQMLAVNPEVRPNAEEARTQLELVDLSSSLTLERDLLLN